MKKIICLFIILILFSCDQTSKSSTSIRVIDLIESSIEDVQTAYQNGTYTCVELVKSYLDRIETIDKDGPQLNSILQVNPDALFIAAQLDKERSEGNIRGPLHGIPMVLKDNIDTKDQMNTTAGARAMKDSRPLQDAFIVTKLREAGVVILGKANLSEWANFHSSYSSSGWSGLGGQTKNPYDTSRNPCGSSSGSGVSVAANLTVLAIGTETNGSIVCPSNNNGIVGIKPTVGLLSRSGIIPISFTQDTPGPMARSVTDAAICLGAMTGVDVNDSKTIDSREYAQTDYSIFLDKDALEGKRIGYYKSGVDEYFRIKQKMDEVISVLQSEGAQVVELEEINKENINQPSYQVLLYEFKDGLNKYFASLGPNAVVKDMDDLIAKTLEDSIEMQYFDHAVLTLANEKGDLTSGEYLNALAKMHRLSRDEGIDRVLSEHSLDAIVSPTGGAAWKTDLINGDRFGLFSSSPAAIAGYPSITVPMGNLDGMPLGVSFYGGAWSEPVLIGIAYAYEQATLHRFAPDL